MQFRRIKVFLAVICLNGLAATASAQTLIKPQPANLPLGYSLIGPTYAVGSDSVSQAFDANYGLSYLNIIANDLPEGVAFTGAGLNRLDPKRLYFLFDYAPRVYFAHDGAGYINALGVTIGNASAPTDNPSAGTNYTVFPYVNCDGTGKRSTQSPLLLGDFVQLPTVKAGQQLAFFLMAELTGKSLTPTNVWYNGDSNNVDDFQHMICFFPDNSQYLIIGFEDMSHNDPACDDDCNDMMFVVDIGPNNAAALRAPSSMPK